MVEIQLAAHRYSAPGAALAFMQELERRVEATPGVAASISGGAPPTGGGFSFNITPQAEGGSSVDFTGIELPSATVASDYFETMGIPIVEGRTFSAEDSKDVVIVNDVLARRFWGSASPIGKRFRVHGKRPWQTVVGVAGDVKQMGPADPMGQGMEVYDPFPADTNRFFALIVRADGYPESLLPTIKQRVWEIDPRQAIAKASTMEARLGDNIARPKFYLMLSSAFAITGALLAAIGVYGISACWVSRRRRELAIRIALGASREAVMAMVIGRSLRLATIGAITGLALVLAGTRLIESMLFQIDGRDPATLVTVTLLLAALVVIGCAGPALKAACVDPMTTLRGE